MQEYTVKVDDNGNKAWYQNGKKHRIDGPAVEYADGTKEWYQNGEIHRLDGPAIEWVDGEKWWYIEGVRYTEYEFLARTQAPRKVTMQEVIEQFGENVGDNQGYFLMLTVTIVLFILSLSFAGECDIIVQIDNQLMIAQQQSKIKELERAIIEKDSLINKIYHNQIWTEEDQLREFAIQDSISSPFPDWRYDWCDTCGKQRGSELQSNYPHQNNLQ